MSVFFDPDLSGSSDVYNDDLAHGTPSLYLTNMSALLVTIITTALILYHMEPVGLFTLWEKALAEGNLKSLLGRLIGNKEEVVDLPAPMVVPFEDKYLANYKALVPRDLDKTTLDNLVNNFVMEYTPNGNVIMFYDVVRETFTYYADNSIPYRYLQVLARKYVCTFNCPSLYKDTIDPVGDSEPSSATDTAVPAVSVVPIPVAPVPEKPSVYAKLKPYNTTAPSKKADAVDKKPVTNRYTCSGKINNMSFLKKVPRTLVDKNYSMSFADFKKQQALSSSSSAGSV
jgi:hypothetical protein